MKNIISLICLLLLIFLTISVKSQTKTQVKKQTNVVKNLKCEWCSKSFICKKECIYTNTETGEKLYSCKGGSDKCALQDFEEYHRFKSGDFPNRYCSEKCACESYRNR